MPDSDTGQLGRLSNEIGKQIRCKRLTVTVRREHKPWLLQVKKKMRMR